MRSGFVVWREEGGEDLDASKEEEDRVCENAGYERKFMFENVREQGLVAIKGEGYAWKWKKRVLVSRGRPDLKGQRELYPSTYCRRVAFGSNVSENIALREKKRVKRSPLHTTGGEIK